MKTIIFALVFLPIVVLANNYPDCNVQNEAFAFFSNDRVKDKLLITIKGSPCYKAELNLRITNADEKILYNYTQSFKQCIVTDWNDPKLDKDAERIAERMIKSNDFQSSASLPAWMPKDEYYEEYYQEIKVTKAYYKSLRQKKWITFKHMNHYEGWQVIVFDRDQHKAIIVSSGGL